MKRAVAAVLLLAACSSGAELKAPTSDWPMYHRTLDRAGHAPDAVRPTKLVKAWTTDLDGAVYGQPLVVAGDVIVATENDTVYALDATTGTQRWRARLGEPVRQSDLPCGNIDPLGITSTPAFDATSNTLYAVTETTGGVHDLVALDAQTGRVTSRRNLDITSRDRIAEQQRGALAIANGRVYVPFGGLFGDCGNYVGYVTAVSASGVERYEVPTAREGGIWAPPGPATHGDVYVSIGNGAATGPPYDGSDAVIRLSPDLSHRVAIFTPPSWAHDNATDTDLGSTGPLLVGNRVVIAGKDGNVYILDANDLHEIGMLGGCTGFGGMAADGNDVFVPCEEGVTSIDIGTMTKRWTASVTGSPVVGGGAVWVVDGGSLRSLDEATGKELARVGVGETTRFASPTVVGATVFVGTTGGVVAVEAEELADA